MGIWTKDDESKDSLVDVASERSTTFPASPARLSLTSPRVSIHGSHANSDSGHLDSHRFSNFSQVLDPMASPRRYSDASAYSMSFVTADLGAGTGGDPYDGEKEERDLKAEPEFQAASKGAGTPTAVGSVPYFQLFKFADTLDWLLVILGSIAAILHGLMMPAGIYVLSKIVGKLGAGSFDGEAYRQVTKVVLILVYLALQALWLSVVEVSCWTIAGDRQSGRIRARYLESLLRQEVAFYDTEMTTGEIVHQISSDSLQIHEAIGEKVASFIHNVSTFVGGLAFMLVEVWQLGLINICFMPLTLGVAITYTKIYSKFAIRSAASLQEGSSVMEQAISQVRTVYSYVGEMRAVQALSQVLDTTVRLGRGGGLAKGLGMGMSLALSNIQWAIVFWVGALLVTGGSKIQGSDILATALTAMYTAMGLSSSLRDVETFLNGKIAAYRIFKVIDRKPLIDALGEGGDTLLSLKGELELSNVHFAYPARPDVPIFKGLNLKIPAAKTVALVGTSGSGKSTVIQLIERFYDPSFGVVKLDGVDIKSLQLKWLRSQMGLVGQEPVLFSTTIRQNIMHGKEGSSEQDVISAATAANAHTFIKDFPEQYDTQVGERGAQLSGGQKQRVAIARAVLKNPAILLLDEATSALDTESEKVVQQAINNVMHGRTTVIIAHRLSTIQDSDLIAVFDRGQIAEIGTHSELLRKGGSGVYYNLVNLQATSEIKTRNPSTSAPHSPLARRSFQTSPMPPRRSFHGSPSTATTLARRSFHSILLKDAYDHSPYSERASPQLEQVRFAASPAVSEMMSPNSAFSVALSPLPPEPSHVETDKGHREMDKEERAKRIPAGDILGLFRGELVIAVVAVVASAIAGIFTPVFSVFSIKTVFYFYGRYTMEQIKHGVAKDCLIFVGLGIGSLFAHAAQHVASNRLGSTISKRTQEKAFSALLENEVGWFDREQNSSAMVTSRLSTDTSVIKIALSERLAFLIQYITAIVVAVAVAFSFSWRMTLVCVTVIPLAMFNGGMRHAFTNSGLSGSTKLAQEKSTQVAAEAVSNIRTVASLGVEGKMVAAFQTEVEGAKKERTRKAFQGAVFMGLAHFSAMSANGLVLWYAAFLLRAGQATFVSALVVFQVMGSTSFQLIESLKIFQDLTRAANATVTTINTIYRGSLINPTTGSEPDAEIVGAIHLQDVSFAYPSRPDIPILQRVNLLIPPNSTTALVGPSGSGKSSIVQLIERFYDPDKGRVLLDGKDIKTLNLRWLRQHIALVQQEPALFATSIRENIRYGKQNATEAEITEAAKAANAHRFISGLPDGYDTKVGERGAQLSGGQKQRIAIARAVLKNPKVLLLDEATSALDAESERVVQEALDRLMQGRRTTVVIAHRLSTIQKVPHIAVINQGQVVESGTHVALLRSRGTYAKLVQLQDLNTSQDSTDYPMRTV